MLTKYLFLFLAIYTLFASLLAFVDHNKYFYRGSKNLEAFTTTFFQPFMNVFGNGKVTHYFHFEYLDNLEKDKLNSIKSLQIKNDSNFRNLAGNTFSRYATSAVADLGYIRTAAVISPKEPLDQRWSLAFCTADKKLCQKSNLLHFGEIKILVDGTGDIYGLSESGEFIELKLDRETTVDKDKNLVLFR